MSSITNNPPGQRELVYCHSCREEWYRDEHGLVCPRCGGDFVEIIENTNDPRDPSVPEHDLPEDFDIDDDDGSSAHNGAAAFVRIEGPNFSYTSTQRNFGPRAHRNREAGGEAGHEHQDDVMVHLFETLLRSVVGDAAIGDGARTPGESPRTGGLGAGQTTGSPVGSPHARTPLPLIFGAPPPMFRFPYDPSARLNPRDADSPQPHGENVVDLPTLLASFFGPGAPDGGGLLARVLGIPAGAGGDYVYSQADLDRVISQLMEQHQGNAPPPAAKDTIESLPKVRVTGQMVRDGQDCAVCKEDLVVDEEIRKLPCNHMYHYECVSRWLEAHDTCPICRHPVTPEEQRTAAPQSPSTSSRPHTAPWPYINSMPPQYRSSSSDPSSSTGPSPAPSGEHGNGGSSSSSSRWSGLFRRRDSDRSQEGR